MRLTGILQLVDHFHASIHCSIITDGIFSTSNVVIDCTRQANASNALCGQICCTTERTVTADDNQTFQTQLLASLLCDFHACFCPEFCTSCCVENRTALMNNIRYAHFVHFKDVTINQTAIPSADAVYLDALLQSSPYNCTNSSIHTRCVPAACQYTNRFDHNFLLHSANWQIFSTKKEILYYDL